jgi:hypothetical protein
MNKWAMPLCLALALGGLLALPTAAMAETITFKAEMLGGNESPANDSQAKGSAEVKVDTATKELQYNVVYSNLSGPAMGAHIHGPADAGNNAGILVPFPHTESPITGSAKLNDQQAQELMDGRLYVNIHTKAHPGGEIRGQLIKAE